MEVGWVGLLLLSRPSERGVELALHLVGDGVELVLANAELLKPTARDDERVRSFQSASSSSLRYRIGSPS